MACGFSPRDLNAQIQVLTARVNTVEQQAAALSFSVKSMTGFLGGMTGVLGPLSAITSIPPLNLAAGLPESLIPMLQLPIIPDFQAIGLSIAMGMIGTVEGAVIGAATSQLAGILSAAQGALTSAQGALSILQAAVPPDPAAILAATGAVTAAQGVVGKATSAISSAAGFATKMSNSACGLVKSSTVSP
jgi:hypothetical protein